MPRSSRLTSWLTFLSSVRRFASEYNRAHDETRNTLFSDYPLAGEELLKVRQLEQFSDSLGKTALCSFLLVGLVWPPSRHNPEFWPFMPLLLSLGVVGFWQWRACRLLCPRCHQYLFQRSRGLHISLNQSAYKCPHCGLRVGTPLEHTPGS